jgi:hypothetical protein
LRQPGENHHRSEALSTCRTKLTSDRLGPGAEKWEAGTWHQREAPGREFRNFSRPQQPSTNSSTMQIALRKMGLVLDPLRLLTPRHSNTWCRFGTLLPKSTIRHEERGHHWGGGQAQYCLVQDCRGAARVLVAFATLFWFF